MSRNDPRLHARPRPPQASALLAWRHELGLTQPQAADALGMSLRSYQRMENGQTGISRETRLACAALFHRLTPIGGD